MSSDFRTDMPEQDLPTKADRVSCGDPMTHKDDLRRIKAVAQILFDDGFGGTSDPIITEMHAAICQDQAEKAVDAIRASDADAGMVLVSKELVDAIHHWASIPTVNHSVIDLEKLRIEILAMIAAHESN